MNLKVYILQFRRETPLMFLKSAWWNYKIIYFI